MIRMSWIRSSKSATLVALFALLLAAAGPAGALTITDRTDFEDSRVGETVSTTVVIEDPFTDQPDEWTLRGSTELENVSWTVTVRQQGNQVNETVYGDRTFEQTLNLENGGSRSGSTSWATRPRSRTTPTNRPRPTCSGTWSRSRAAASRR